MNAFFENSMRAAASAFSYLWTGARLGITEKKSTNRFLAGAAKELLPAAMALLERGSTFTLYGGAVLTR